MRMRRQKLGGKTGRATEAAELTLEIFRCSFRLRALGRKVGLVTSWGAGSYGFLRSLAQEGPLTVPEIARARPTSRQRMQRLADELAHDGLVEFSANPRHRRSKLVRLTVKGQARYRTMTERLLKLSESLTRGLSAGELSVARRIVTGLSERLLTPADGAKNLAKRRRRNGTGAQERG
jgi:DNA-binding MarR family transcriptional regulator